jgi:hypothetical protein
VGRRSLPLGYENKDGKIAVVKSDPEQLRLIYRRYLELSGVNALVRDLRERNIRKTRLLATGGTLVASRSSGEHYFTYPISARSDARATSYQACSPRS